MKMTLRGVRLYIIVSFNFVLLGCVGFAGKLPPSYTYEQIPHVEPKPAITYDVKLLSFGQEYQGDIGGLMRTIKGVFLLSEAFSNVEAAPGPDGYHLSVRVDIEWNKEIAAISKVVSALTLAVFPAFERDHITLTVDVTRNGNPIKQYIYKDYLDLWRQIFLIPLMSSHYPKHVTFNLMEHMLLKFVYDAVTDQILMEKVDVADLLSEGPLANLHPVEEVPLH